MQSLVVGPNCEHIPTFGVTQNIDKASIRLTLTASLSLSLIRPMWGPHGLALGRADSGQPGCIFVSQTVMQFDSD